MKILLTLVIALAITLIWYQIKDYINHRKDAELHKYEYVPSKLHEKIATVLTQQYYDIVEKVNTHLIYLGSYEEGRVYRNGEIVIKDNSLCVYNDEWITLNDLKEEMDEENMQ